MSGLTFLMAFGALCWNAYLHVQVLDLRNKLELMRKSLKRLGKDVKNLCEQEPWGVA